MPDANSLCGDKEYLALAKHVRDEVVRFGRKMDDDGGPHCLAVCNDYHDVLLTLHIRELLEGLDKVANRANAVVERLGVVLQNIGQDKADDGDG